MWPINTFGSGDVLSDVIRSIVFLMGGGYESLLRLGMLCLVFGGIVSFLGRGRIQWQWVFGAIVILAVTLNIRMTVLVHDLVNPGVPDQVIGNVPLAVAFPAYMTSEISYQTMVGVETTFGLPAEYRVVNSSIGRGFFDMQKTMMQELIPGDLQANVTNYLKDCVFREIELNRLQREPILNSPNMVTAIAVTNAALPIVEIRLGNQFAQSTCPEMYDRWIVNGLANGEPDYDETMRQFRAVLGVLDVPDGELTPVQAFITNIMGSGQGPRALINNVLLRERWKDADRQSAEEGNDTASAVVQMTKSITADIKNQAYADSLISARFVPLMRTVSESVVYLLTPLMLALAMSPAMFATIRGLVLGYGWLFMWIPMYAILNFVVYQYGVQQMAQITVGLISFNSFDDYSNVLIGLNTFSGRLIWAVPTLATVAAYGMSSLASAVTGATAGAQSAAAHEASQYAHGDGKYVEPGQHLKEEHSPMVQDASGGFHAGSSYFRGGTGTMVHHQGGNTSVGYGDGSSMMVSRDGMTKQYHGPEGSWSKHGDEYMGGVWRQPVQGADGQMHSAQFEVSGDHVDVSYMGRDGNNVQHDYRETWNQRMNQQKSLSDTWSEGGFTKELRTQGDHQQLFTAVGTAAVPMSVNGRTETVMADVTASFSRPSADSSWSGGVMTAHSTEHGEHRYALSNVGLNDQGMPDFSKGMTVTSSDGTNLHTQHSSEHGLMTTTTEGNAGELTRSYSGASHVEVFHADGSHETLAGVVHGQGGVAADGSGQPFQSSFTVDQDGYRGELRGEMSYNQQQGRWEMHAPTEDWSARLEAHSSGMMMQVGDLQLVGGHLQKYGGRDSQNWSYNGPVIDGNNVVSRGHVESKDGQVFFSDLDHGGTQRVIGDGGRQLTLRNNPGSSDYTYEESFTGQAWQDDGHGNLKAIGQTHFTSHGYATVDPERSGSLFDRLIRTPDTTTAVNKGAFGERSLAVSMEPRPLSELPVGSGKLTLDGLGSDGASELKGGEGTGYVISAGAGSQKFNAIETVQNVQGADGQKSTQRLVQDSSQHTVSGAVSGVVDKRVADHAGNLHSSTLGRGGDGTGDWRMLTSETSNRNSFSGSFLVPGLDGQGTARVAGGIEMSPEGDIVSMHFTNTATGKQIGYHEGERGPVFSVGDVEADPKNPGQFRLTNVREVSHREAESAGGFVVRDVLNQAGERIWSEGNKGIEFHESRAYMLNTKIDETSTMVSKGQQSLEVLGLSDAFDPDKPGPWKEAAQAAEGVRLGWSTSMDAMRIGRFRKSADKITGGSPRPYDPQAPVDPEQRGIYDNLTSMREEFKRQRGISSGSSRR